MPAIPAATRRLTIELTDFHGQRFAWDQALELWFPVLYPPGSPDELGQVRAIDEAGERVLHLHPVVSA